MKENLKQKRNLLLNNLLREADEKADEAAELKKLITNEFKESKALDDMNLHKNGNEITISNVSSNMVPKILKFIEKQGFSKIRYNSLAGKIFFSSIKNKK